ncbi:SAM-dependent methyltransferase [Nonomuraea dietziae]|uniref:Uncharacterized protein n=1 Tax=Nonomuraea dietziae TaxID=65515 RepID=A0A7W5V733_9ACTN|nr:hypothetical protein [Nonomuraea dietziae]MBB3731832.1 hypothetical protein [Nonomuraea dietziae]
MTALSNLVRPDVYPGSSLFGPAWRVGLDMGPNPLWLLEDLSADLGLKPGMRVLDLGSGMGATSVFLAREFGVEVVAADLWIVPLLRPGDRPEVAGPPGSSRGRSEVPGGGSEGARGPPGSGRGRLEGAGGPPARRGTVRRGTVRR